MSRDRQINMKLPVKMIVKIIQKENNSKRILKIFYKIKIGKNNHKVKS
jgi:hypothetical protein